MAEGTVKVERLSRKFSYNGVSLPDPGANYTPEQVRDIYTANYPELVAASVEGPEVKGKVLQFTFRRAVGTKG